MKSHELPPEGAGLEPGEAQAEINKVLADARGDPEHPLNRRDHPQHADLMTRISALQESANPTAPPAEPLEDYEREEIQERIARIERTPGFIDGTLRRENRAQHDRLVAARARLYEKLHPPEGVEGKGDEGGETPDDDEGDGDEDDDDAGQRVLCEQAAAEMKRLVELGFEPADVPRDVPPHTVTGLKMQRLLAEGNERELRPLIEAEMKKLGADSDVQRGALTAIISWIHAENERRFGGGV
jgi:hypothetical protein